MACLDIEKCNNLSECIEKLTTSGKGELDKDLMKRIKKICKTSDDYVRHTYHLIMTQMNKDHSEIRYSALLIVNELFYRSHIFREMVLSEFQEFLELTAEIDLDAHLPPPKAAAKNLKLKTLEFVQDWHRQFGVGYKRLVLGYNFLKNCKMVDFNDALARSFVQRSREQLEQQYRENISSEKVNKAANEMKGSSAEICSILTQIENCISLLQPHYDDLFTEHDFTKNTTSDKKKDICAKSMQRDNYDNSTKANIEKSNNDAELNVENMEDLSSGSENTESSMETETLCYAENNNPKEIKDEDTLRHHGFHDRKYNLTIEINKNLKAVIQENDDTTPVIETLRDIHSQITNNILPAISGWLKVFTKGTNCTDSLKKAIDFKQLLEEAVSKVKDLKIIPSTLTSGIDKNPDDDDDDDFEEVKEKEGFEPVIPFHKRKEYGLDPGPSTSTAKISVSSSEKLNSTNRLWNLESEEDSFISDPTTRLSTIFSLLNKYKESPSDQSSSTSVDALQASSGEKSNISMSENSRKAKLLSIAPVKPYDIDLYHWEEEKLEAPLIFKYDSLHTFWQRDENEHGGIRDEKTLIVYHFLKMNEVLDMEAKRTSLTWQVVCMDDLSQILPTNKLDYKLPAIKEGVAALRQRHIDFSGKFVPVKWSCRAPLSSGKLCPRKDRYKCPFHGPIIERDEQGNPVNSGDPNRQEMNQPSTSKADGLPDWQDPELLRDIEAAIGINLEIPQKRKKSDKSKGGSVKGKKQKKYPGLTDIKRVQNTPRKRLEKKVLDKASVKRVSEVLDTLDKKRFNDKFGHQWNYAFQL